MVIITLQYYSAFIKDLNIFSLKEKITNIEEFGIKEKEFSKMMHYPPIYTLDQYREFLLRSRILSDN